MGAHCGSKQMFNNKEEENKWWEAHCRHCGHNEWYYGKSKNGVYLLKCYFCRERVGPHRNGTGPHRNGSQPPPEFKWHSQTHVPKEQMPKDGWRKVKEGNDRVICLPVAEGYVFEEGYDTLICIPVAEGYVFYRPEESAGYTQSCTASDDAQSCRSRALRSSEPPAKGPPSPHILAVSPLTLQPEVLQDNAYADSATAEAWPEWFRSLDYDRDYNQKAGRYWSAPGGSCRAAKTRSCSAPAIIPARTRYDPYGITSSWRLHTQPSASCAGDTDG